MPNSYRGPHDAITAILRASAVVGVDWGDRASPWYEQVPEPPPAFPYVAYRIDPSSISHNLDTPGENNVSAYVEKFVVTVEVVALRNDIINLASPYVDGSITRFLDAYAHAEMWEQLDGVNYYCMKFTRADGWVIHQDPSLRDSHDNLLVGGSRVWKAEIPYDFWVSAAYPQAPTP